MGDLNRILVTGAAGFVGSSVVTEARARGLPVVAVVRGEAPGAWDGDPGIKVLRADLADVPDLPQVDAVIHAAAYVGDDPDRHARDTLAATRALLDRMTAARLVLVSSISVYDTMLLQPGDVLDESTPIEPSATARSGYVAAKLEQEAMCRAWGGQLWIMRPGVVYGPGHSWNAHMGLTIGGTHVQIGTEGEVPLVHVTHLAKALVTAVLTDPQGSATLNVIDDDCPTRGRFLSAHRAATGWPGRSVTLSYDTWRKITSAARPLANRLPGLLGEPVMRSRLMPLVYPNAALRARLGGGDDAPFEDMLRRSVAGGTP